MQDNASAIDRGDLTAAAQEWLSHRPVHSAVPLAEAVAELRFRYPNAAVSDQALELLVAELALQRGLAIRLDRRPVLGPASPEGTDKQPAAGAGQIRG